MRGSFLLPGLERHGAENCSGGGGEYLLFLLAGQERMSSGGGEARLTRRTRRQRAAQRVEERTTTTRGYGEAWRGGAEASGELEAGRGRAGRAGPAATRQ